MLILFLIRDRFRVGKTRSRKEMPKERQGPENYIGIPPMNARSLFNQGPLSRRKDKVQKKLGIFSLQLSISFLTGTAFAKERQGPEKYS